MAPRGCHSCVGVTGIGCHRLAYMLVSVKKSSWMHCLTLVDLQDAQEGVGTRLCLLIWFGLSMLKTAVASHGCHRCLGVTRASVSVFDARRFSSVNFPSEYSTSLILQKENDSDE